MSGDLPLQGGLGSRKWTLADGIAEARRELELRERVYPRFIALGSLTEHEAMQQVWAMQGIERFLVFCANHEVRLRGLVEEFMAQDKQEG